MLSVKFKKALLGHCLQILESEHLDVADHKRENNLDQEFGYWPQFVVKWCRFPVTSSFLILHLENEGLFLFHPVFNEVCFLEEVLYALSVFFGWVVRASFCDLVLDWLKAFGEDVPSALAFFLVRVFSTGFVEVLREEWEFFQHSLLDAFEGRIEIIYFFFWRWNAVISVYNRQLFELFLDQVKVLNFPLRVRYLRFLMPDKTRHEYLRSQESSIRFHRLFNSPHTSEWPQYMILRHRNNSLFTSSSYLAILKILLIEILTCLGTWFREGEIIVFLLFSF